MSDETKAAIERLRVYADAGLKAHIGIDLNTDILTVCNAAEQRDDLLAKIEYERSEDDTKRLVAAAKEVDLAYQQFPEVDGLNALIMTGAFNRIGEAITELREAIASAMKENECTTSGIESRTRQSNPATKVQSSVAGKSLRETAERIIEGIPVSYRDGDEEAGRERTVKWLMELLSETINPLREMIAKMDKADKDWESSYWKCLADLEKADADTKRLDWLEKQDPKVKGEIAMSSIVGAALSIRNAIDAAMKEEK